MTEDGDAFCFDEDAFKAGLSGLPHLEFVLLNGCKTARLGQAIRSACKVPDVITWSTSVLDGAAKLFS